MAQVAPRLCSRLSAGALALATTTAAATGTTASTASAPTTTVVTGATAPPTTAIGTATSATTSSTATVPTAPPPKPSPAVLRLEHQVAARASVLDARRAQLQGLRTRLAAAGRRLGGLRIARFSADRVLAEQLVGAYENDRPDLVSVVIGSSGFNELLDSVAFVERITIQNARVLARVRAARIAVADEARTLGQLSARTAAATGQVQAAQERMTADQVALATRQLAAVKAQAVASSQLAAAQAQVARLTGELQSLQASTAVHSSGAAPATAPAGRIAFPVPVGDAAPAATWSLGQGVDLAAPAGTPELAVCSGTIVLHGIGGLGQWAPVLRCSTPIAGHNFVYYGFAGPTALVPVGTDVTRGQMIARVGPGTIGTSTGPHLEIGFTDASGSPLGRTSATQLLPLLRVADAG